MSATRGARYLLRNGLDYLNYQQYERALKFLREAEARKKELNDAERTVLKQGVQSAQRGLRQAADAEFPYALSEQSRNRNGFRPAKPEIPIADRSKAPTRQPAVNRSIPANPAANDVDDQGEPIRLASSTAASSEPNSQTRGTSRSIQADTTNPGSSQDDDPPRMFPEIPRLPKFEGPSDVDVSTGELNRDVIQSWRAMTASTNLAGTMPVSKEETVASHASVTGTVPVSTTMLAPTTGLPQPVTVESAPKETPNLTVVDLVTVPSSAPPAKATQVPDQELLPDKELDNATPALMPEQLVNLSPTPAGSALATKLVQTGDPGLLTHKETDYASPASMLKQPASARPTPTVSALSLPATSGAAANLPLVPVEHITPVTATNLPPQDSPVTTAPPGATDDLPPLPADLSGSVGHASSTPDPVLATTAVPDAPAVMPNATDDLPPLPGDLSSSEARAPSAVNDSSALSGPEKPSSTTANVSLELSSVQSTGHKEEVEALPLLPVTEKQNVTMPATTAVTLSEQPTIAQLGTSESSFPLLDSESREVPPSNPPLLVSDPERAQEPAVPAVPAVTGATEAHDGVLLPPAIENQAPFLTRSDSFIPNRANPPSTLRPELKREVEMIVRKQEDDLRRKQQTPAQPLAPVRDTIVSDLRAQTQLDISRAPSPAEARPIKAIPVPEDWVPLPSRTWAAQRKYWAAAATCHLPLYFQDPVLERYGHSVEQFVGPIGRFLTYPVDDPTQSTQRNQIVQPFFSAGLFALQIAAWPYNLIMDPPWEAQYDLGYYRPGDLIPTDTYWLPLHGYGPPLRGSNY